MTTIFQRIENKLKRIEKDKEKQAMKEVIHTRVEELYRGKDWTEKLKGIIRILSA